MSDKESRKTARLMLRTLMFVLAGIWAWYIISLFRTMTFGGMGTWWGYPYVATVFVLPVAILVSLGLSIKRMAVAIIMICLASTAGAEIFARTQEASFRDRCLAMGDDAESVEENRWWPFQSSAIGYDSTNKEFYGRD